jgi:hypothetical protein
MVRNAGPPNSELSTVSWTLLCFLEDGSPALMRLVVSEGAAAFDYLPCQRERSGQ